MHFELTPCTATKSFDFQNEAFLKSTIVFNFTIRKKLGCLLFFTVSIA